MHVLSDTDNLRPPNARRTTSSGSPSSTTTSVPTSPLTAETSLHAPRVIGGVPYRFQSVLPLGTLRRRALPPKFHDVSYFRHLHPSRFASCCLLSVANSHHPLSYDYLSSIYLYSISSESVQVRGSPEWAPQFWPRSLLPLFTRATRQDDDARAGCDVQISEPMHVRARCPLQLNR